MKSGLSWAMSGNVSIQMDPQDAIPPHLSRSAALHSRSASWSFTRGQGRGASDLSFTALTPLTTVIRELVPSLGHADVMTPESLSRAASQVSLTLTRATGYDTPPSLATDTPTTTAPQSSTEGQPQFPEEQNVGPELGDGVRWLEHNAVFALILLLRFAWFHRSGLVVILGMCGTYLHCNRAIRNQVSLKNKRKKGMLFLIIIFLAANISFVYYVFADQSLYNCFIFQIPQFTIDLWNLLWCICVTDYIVRFSTMMLKAVIVLLPSLFLPSRSKGKYYMLFEHASNLYRTFLPTPLWFRYLSNSHSSGAIFATVITALYVMIKGIVLFGKVKETYRAAVSFLQDPFFGTTPSREDLHQMGQSCSICQEDICHPVMLRCRHIFCEDCVLRWLDRQSSCPLCRASVATDPQWRDGSTAAWPQLF